ncbi:MAG: glycoside hydrolase family 32 protein, partial [Schaalia hyovaginalis]|nr:glycoside hydrolase family 32 protein [Schaalia hyovaginalis]
RIRLTPESLEVDRSASRYPHGDVRRVGLEAGEASRIELVHDRSLTEIVLGGGSRVFTFRSFLTGEGAGLRLLAEGGAGVVDAEFARLD